MKYIAYSLLIVLFSCHRKEGSNKALSGKIGSFKKIILPGPNIVAHKQLKIVTYINGDCYGCVKELEKWQGFYINDSSRAQFLFYFSSMDTAHFFSYIKKHFDVGFQLIYDKEEEYLTKNNIEKYDKMFQTFLLDRDNKVILIGNPLYNKKLAELYRREISKRTNNNRNANE